MKDGVRSVVHLGDGFSILCWKRRSPKVQLSGAQREYARTWQSGGYCGVEGWQVGDRRVSSGKQQGGIR